METIAFLGASRGLGRAVAGKWSQLEIQPIFVARGKNQLESLNQQCGQGGEIWIWDFSQVDRIPSLLNRLREASPDRLIYFAAGGPYGDFSKKDWKDHLWSLRVSFEAPAHLLHGLLQAEAFPKLKQIIFIGSAIADDQADPKASSYAAAKHGLRGLVESVIQEGPKVDLRLFRPGYLDTDLLPANAAPRQAGEVLDVSMAADNFLTWAQNPKGEKVFTLKHPFSE
ncbi:MAG: SDR family oxidoreductase [Bdellovibrionales bacterium]|nr:SDR family oxidoreductase [Bdellovibrionales bacterium]